MILSIDPGPHTGFALWYFPDSVQSPATDPANFRFETLDLREVLVPHVSLYDKLEVLYIAGNDTVVLEKFEYHKEKAEQRGHLDFTAAEYVGVVKLWAHLRPNYRIPTLCLQSPSQAVGNQRKADRGDDNGIFWDDEKLKRLGLYQLTRDNHQRSALRHLLYHVTFCVGDKRFLLQLGSNPAT